MSDFDEEAERRKLEERFAEEDEKREQTERMSELLLQGATMTDTHCNECGNPLFRYDGQTFCPTCQRTVSDGETTDTTAGTTPAENAPEDEPAPTDGVDPADGTANATPDGQRNATEARTHPTNARDSARIEESGSQDENAPAGEPQRPSTRDRRAPPSRSPDDAEIPPAAGGTTDLAAAEASLSRVLRRQAETAERTDDLGRAREHLAAAREAATALDAVRTARR